MRCTFVGSFFRVEAVHQVAPVKSDDRRDEINRIVIIVDEGDDGIVPSVNDSDRGGCGTKINSESHDTHTSVY